MLELSRMSILTNLNPEQQEAVTYSIDGEPLLVLAGAGSGKTKVLTHRVAWLIKHGIGPNNILLLTFTNKAAGEMKARVEKLTSTSPLFAGTFHSFCAKLLRIDGVAIGISKDFVIYDSQDSKDAISGIIEELNLSKDTVKPAAILSIISEAKSQMLSPVQYGELVKGTFQETAFKIYLKYEKLLGETGALDFDDLLLKAVTLLNNNQIRQKWQQKLTHVFVDEWQDTNKIQYKLTQQIVGDANNLTAVGDASQSIYSWRGANYKNINYLIKDYPKIKIINLERNYRSTQNILSAANSVIKKNTSHPILNLWTKKGEGEKIKLYRATSGFDEASFITSEVLSLQTRGFSLNDFAVLYRTNAQSRVMEEAMLHAGIPYRLVGGLRFYERKEIKDAISYLRLLVNNKDSVSLKRVEKQGVRRFQKFKEFQKNISLVGLSTLDLLDSVLKKTDYLDKYKRESEENLIRLENLKELRSVATQFPDIHEFLENIALVEASKNSKGGESLSTPSGDNDAITLMTLHAAKGLEFPVIFIVGLEEGLFPHSRSLFDVTQLEEERRLAYVGITRAMDHLYLTFANKRLYFGQRTSNPPSRFLIDIPENLLETSQNFSRIDEYSDSSINF